jgi:hypothetical protein
MIPHPAKIVKHIDAGHELNLNICYDTAYSRFDDDRHQPVA